ncbi:MAG: hypothetical protein KAJ19_05530 [Gammaproteobacteria bacterium]|nr:hypothetical protein [Gammaproteobacteria bacterium]
MGHRYFPSFFIASLLTLLSATVAAAPDEPEEQVQWYEVELIVFSQANAPYQQDELWTDSMEPLSMEGVMELRPHVMPQNEVIHETMDEQEQPNDISTVDTAELAVAAKADAEVAADTIEDDAELSMTPEEQAFRTLPQELLQLVAEYERLVDSEIYEPLLHVGWRQPGLAREEAIAVHIHDGVNDLPDEAVEAEPVAEVLPEGDATEVVDMTDTTPSYSMDQYGEIVYESLPAEESTLADEELIEAKPAELPRLNGTVKLILARYLHLDVDLGYRLETETEIVPTAVPDISAWLNLNLKNDSLIDFLEDAETESNFEAMEPIPNKIQYQVFRLQQKRRMRSKELHYLDQPMFGIIALITPYEFPVIEEEPPPIEWQRVN